MYGCTYVFMLWYVQYSTVWLRYVAEWMDVQHEAIASEKKKGQLVMADSIAEEAREE